MGKCYSILDKLAHMKVYRMKCNGCVELFTHPDIGSILSYKDAKRKINMIVITLNRAYDYIISNNKDITFDFVKWKATELFRMMEQDGFVKMPIRETIEV